MADSSPLTTKPDSTAPSAAPSILTASAVKRKSWSREDLLPALSGLMLGLAFAPTNLVILAFIGLLPLLIYLDGPITVTRIKSEEHTSELQSLRHLVCRLLLE